MALAGMVLVRPSGCKPDGGMRSVPTGFDSQPRLNRKTVKGVNLMAKLRIRITYCLPCGHQPHAIQLANQLLGDYGMKFNHDMELTLVPVDKGEFDVYVNGAKVFSHREVRRMPTTDEIKQALEQQLAPVNA